MVKPCVLAERISDGNIGIEKKEDSGQVAFCLAFAIGDTGSNTFGKIRGVKQ
jgi:hypothetical protein